MSVNHLGNPIIYYFTASSITISILFFMHKLENKSLKIMDILTIFGKNSIVLLVTNNLIIEMLRLIDYKILGNLFMKSRICGSATLTLLILDITLIFALNNNSVQL